MNYEIKTGKLIVGDGTVKENISLGIKNGVIVEMANDINNKYDEKIDYSDKIIMPGLIDAHVHLVYSGIKEKDNIEKLSDEYLTLRAAELAKKALLSGATTLADAGGVRNVVFGLRNAINDGVLIGPRIKASGSMITITGGRATYGHRVIGGGYEVDGPDEARKKTRNLLMYYGADFIKLGATGALSSPHTGARDPQLTVEEMRACVEEAHNCGKKVHAHCYGERGITNALDAGVDVIVHGQTLTEEHIRRMKESGTILMPTLSTFQEKGYPSKEEGYTIKRPESSAGVYEETEANFRNAVSKGVPITMGTDSGMPGTLCGNNPKDLVFMVKWGMKPIDAITSGTLIAAKSIAAEKQLGTIETGKFADMLILEKDPLNDINILTKESNIHEIILNGEMIKNKLKR